MLSKHYLPLIPKIGFHSHLLSHKHLFSLLQHHRARLICLTLRLQNLKNAPTASSSSSLTRPSLTHSQLLMRGQVVLLALILILNLIFLLFHLLILFMQHPHQTLPTHHHQSLLDHTFFYSQSHQVTNALTSHDVTIQKPYSQTQKTLSSHH